ncbi:MULTISPECIES: hypothetical protein [unclassified Sulfuricurvum]|uniref:hypothetical protein n=1 Tax=unclassified Sulfuricurvum TaxID=2632390 RepID=UPI00029971B2|nr:MULTISPECIES: hypothetical protein [unclassified Sulfuricurvum]AFV96598.1 hypothetical protein B649_01420 [Candidatus Sulfuricurvum sp. RIFRC-1]HBM36054.1 hypothetical protein [Sulfuricurvum sp.]
MKMSQLFLRIVVILTLISINIWAAVLDTDDFSAGSENWSNGSVVSSKYKIASQVTASKIFVHSAYANEPIKLTLTLDQTGYDSGESYIITINGVQVTSSNLDETVTFNGYLNTSGELNVTVKSNSSSSSEYVTIDDVSLETGALNTIDNFRDFELLTTYNINGNMQIIGNSVMLENGGTCPNTTTNNNDLDPVWADKDTNATTWNSTSANLKLPAGVDSTKIKYAGLYWQGRVDSGEAFSSGNTILFKPEGFTSYQSITSLNRKFNWSIRSQDRSYQGIDDVTSLVKQSIDKVPSTTIVSSGFSGTFWAANILAKEMRNGFGAWSLVIVYEDSTDTLKNISVYDGYKEVTGNTPVPITLTGFLTPNTTPVNSKFLIFGGEGDISLNDSTTLTNNVGTDISLGSNVFNSSETNSSGSNITTRNPSCQNTIGIDIHTFDIGTNGSPSIIGTGQTTTTIKLKGASSDSDTYYPGVFAFSTDIYQPQICYIENIFKGNTNISGIGTQVNEDDNLTVRVYIKNQGTEAATGVQIRHQFDSSFPYSVNSANYNNSNPAYETLMPPSYTRTTASDSSGNDLYEYNSTTTLAKINLGVGATATSGGQFNTISSGSPTYAVFEYSAIVKAIDNNYSNVYQAGYINSVLGLDYTNNPVVISSCDGSKNSFWGYRAPTPTGTVDVVDPDKLVTYSTAPVIKTKIAKKDSVQLKVVYLNPATLAIKNYIPFIASSNQPLRVMLYRTDSPCSTSAPELALAEPTTGNLAGQPVVAYISPNENNASTNTFVMKAIASKDSKILAKYADWSSIMQGLDNTAPCFNNSNDAANFNGLPQCLNSLGSASEDNLAADLRAKYPSIATMCLNQTVGDSACDSNAYQSGGSKGYIIPSKYNHSYGCLACILDAIGDTETCSRDNFAIRPNAFNNTITANQQFTAMQPTSITFRADQFGGTGTVDYNETEHTSFVVDVNISDSTKNCQDMNISFSPSIDFIDGNVTDNYTLSNVGDFNVTMHEINGSEYALVDSDSGDTLEVDRLITPYQVQIKVVPDHFALDGNLTNGSNGFTYLSNFEQYDSNDSRNISAVLDMNISALAADNNITTNYNASCYAKSGNLTLSLANAIAVTPSGALSKVIWYHYAPDHNGSIVFNGTMQYSIPFLNTQFDNNDTNGTGQFDYRINFDRNQILLVNPFNIVINEINATDTDSVDGNRTMSTNNNAYYVYGRVIPRDIRVFGGATPFTANAYYEVYNAPSINGTLPASKNESAWYTNTQHSDLSTTYDGDANVTYIGSAALAPPMSSNVGNDGTEDYTDSDGMALGGYKAHINTDPWLWYGINALGYADPGMNVNGTVDGTVNSDDCINHPCFNITIVPSIGATGSAKSTNEGTKASKKSDSGGGTWKSTSDYAPAIR